MSKQDLSPTAEQLEVCGRGAALVGLDRGGDFVAGQEAPQGWWRYERALVLAEVEETKPARVKGQSSSDAIAQGSPLGLGPG